MPNKQAAKKALRQNRRHNIASMKVKTNVKALRKISMELVNQGKKTEALAAYRSYQQAIDKAAKRNVVSFNAASRKKSALLRMVNKVQ